MSEFREKVCLALVRAGVASGNRILIGCSGGPDSVSLLDALHLLAPGLGLELAVACFNHGLRAEAADEVEQVRRLAQDRSLPFYTGSPKPRDRSAGRSDQAWARKVRMAFLEEAGKESKADLLALAHTADDQAETVLMRLVRGSGLRGLGGMSLIGGGIVRPLLLIRREEVLAYLGERSLAFAQDPSNLNPKYMRVRMRRTLLPLLAQENPRIVENLCGLALGLQSDLYILEELAAADLERLGRREGGAYIIDRTGFLERPSGAARRLVRQAYAQLKGDRRSLTRDHVEAVLALARTGTGETHLPEGFRALAGPGELVLAHRKAALLQPLAALRLPGPGRYTLSTGWTMEVEEGLPPKVISPDPNQAVMDLDKLSWPLEIRPVRPGDRISPLGLDGSKKLSDLYIDRKVGRRERDRIPVVVHRGEVAWVAGMALSRGFVLGPETKKALRIRLIRPET